MKVVKCMLRSGFAGYKVVNLATGKTVYSSAFEADCNQYVYHHEIMKGGVRY